VTKIPEKINLKEKRFIFDHSFTGFSLWSLGTIVSEAVVRQNIIAWSVWWSKADYLRQALRGRMIYILSDLLCPTMPHFLKFPSPPSGPVSYDSILISSEPLLLSPPALGSHTFST
jgi:hypothetical protein